jgi:hypothetical protein
MKGMGVAVTGSPVRPTQMDRAATPTPISYHGYSSGGKPCFALDFTRSRCFCP